MKCEKCGHFNPYWRPDWRDTEREFARTEDGWPKDMPVAFQGILAEGEVIVWGGFAWKATKKFIRRIPEEIYKSRGRWGLPYKAKDYYDATCHPSGLTGKSLT